MEKRWLYLILNPRYNHAVHRRLCVQLHCYRTNHHQFCIHYYVLPRNTFLCLPFHRFHLQLYTTQVTRSQRGWMNEGMNEWMNGWINEWMNEWVNEWISGWMNEFPIIQYNDIQIIQFLFLWKITRDTLTGFYKLSFLYGILWTI